MAPSITSGRARIPAGDESLSALFSRKQYHTILSLLRNTDSNHHTVDMKQYALKSLWALGTADRLSKRTRGVDIKFPLAALPLWDSLESSTSLHEIDSDTIESAVACMSSAAFSLRTDRQAASAFDQSLVRYSTFSLNIATQLRLLNELESRNHTVGMSTYNGILKFSRYLPGGLDDFLRVLGLCRRRFPQFRLDTGHLQGLAEIFSVGNLGISVCCSVTEDLIQSRVVEKVDWLQVMPTIVKKGDTDLALALCSTLLDLGRTEISLFILEIEIAEGLLRDKCVERISRFLRNHVESGALTIAQRTRFQTTLYETAIKAYLKSPTIESLYKQTYIDSIFQELLKARREPTIRVFMLYIDLFNRTGKFEMALYLYQHIASRIGLAFEPSCSPIVGRIEDKGWMDSLEPRDRWLVATFRSFIETGANALQLLKASKFTVLLNVIIDGVSFSGHTRELLVCLERKLADEKSRRYLNINVFNTIIEAYARAGECEQAYRSLLEAEKLFGRASISRKTIGSLLGQIKRPDDRRKMEALLSKNYNYLLPK